MIRNIVSIKYIHNYLKNKSIEGFGKLKCKNTDIFFNTFEIYYEW